MVNVDEFRMYKLFVEKLSLDDKTVERALKKLGFKAGKNVRVYKGDDVVDLKIIEVKKHKVLSGYEIIFSTHAKREWLKEDLKELGKSIEETLKNLLELKENIELLFPRVNFEKYGIDEIR